MHGKEEAPAIRILEEAGEDVGRLEYRFVERGGTKDAARQLGPHLQPSSPENAERLTGYKPGGICPFGPPSPLPVFAQISLFNLGMLYINAGVRGVIAVIRPEALRLSGAVAGDILSGGPRR